MTWLIALPVWGKDYVDTFLIAALPSIRAAMKASGGDFRFIVHTNLRGGLALWPAMRDLNVTYRPLPKAADPHSTLGAAHRAAIAMANPGEYIAFLTADLVLSKECFASSEKRFAEGKQLLIMAASRSLRARRCIAPIGATSRELLQWTVDNRHPSITECCWPCGTSIIPWAVYFKGPRGTVLRGFHLHPFAAVKSDQLAFSGVTIDHDLCDCFEEQQIHVVTSADEMALAELSPLSRDFAHLPYYFNERYIAEWAFDRATKRQRWLFNHRIIIQGDSSDNMDLKPCLLVNKYLRTFEKVAA